jgi:hypothetical protein
MYKIDVRLHGKFLTNESQCLIIQLRLEGLIFGCVILFRQLHFHIYYLFVGHNVFTHFVGRIIVL